MGRSESNARHPHSITSSDQNRQGRACLHMHAVRSLLGSSLLALGLAGCGDSVGGFIELPGQGDAQSTSLPLDPATADGPFSDLLVACVTAPDRGESCLLDALPLLGQEPGSPTVDDVLDRTVVSHSWMAQRFRQALVQMPPVMLQLFNGVTAVVIAGDIRPAYYSPANGAIHLDPADLWLTNQEKATISAAPDYRSDFGAELGFVGLWRYMDGLSYAWDYYPLDGTETRTIDDVIRPLAATLFHELGHANDFFPPSVMAGLDTSLSVFEAYVALEDNSVSAQVAAAQPLNSQVWAGLAQVLYRGEQASAEQRALTPGQVGLEFQTDGANDDYAYTDRFEDTAMLFEEVMLKYHFGMDREIAYTDVPPPGEEGFCDSYIVRWGYRGRAGEPLVKARAEQVLQGLLGRPDVAAELAALGAPAAMPADTAWCAPDVSVTALLSPADGGMDGPTPLRESDRRRPH